MSHSYQNSLKRRRSFIVDRGQRHDRGPADHVSSNPCNDDLALIIDRDRLHSVLRSLESFCGE